MLMNYRFLDERWLRKRGRSSVTSGGRALLAGFLSSSASSPNISAKMLLQSVSSAAVAVVVVV